MTPQPEKWETVKALFQAASAVSLGKRAAFLLRNCPDPALRAEVERQLSEYEKAGTFLWRPDHSSSSTPSQVRQRFSSGELLADRFKIIRFIAAGGMGEVYEADDLELGEHVAIKAIHSEVLEKPNAIAQFKREVHLARKVTHPNVCRIFDLFRHDQGSEGSDAETVFVSMELLHGRTLAQTIEESGRMTMEAALPLVKQMASALRAAHDVGIVHRDPKPGNVVLVQTQSADGVRAAVTDFGIARQSSHPTDGTSTSSGS